MILILADSSSIAGLLQFSPGLHIFEGNILLSQPLPVIMIPYFSICFTSIAQQHFEQYHNAFLLQYQIFPARFIIQVIQKFDFHFNRLLVMHD